MAVTARRQEPLLKRAWSIRNRFLLFGLLSLLPMMGLGGFLIVETSRSTRNELVSSQATTSSLASASVTNFLTVNFRSLENLANNPAIVENPDPDVVNGILGQSRTYRTEQIGLYLLGPEGNLIGQSGIESGLVLPDIGAQIESVLTTGQRAVTGRFQLSLDQPTNVVVLLVPVTTLTETETSQPNGTPTAASDDIINEPTAVPSSQSQTTTRPAGSTLGVVACVIPIESINLYVIPQNRGRSDIVLVAADQVISSNSEIMQQEDAFLERLNAERDDFSETATDTFSMRGLNNNERTATYAPLQMDGVHWAVVVTSPTPDNLLTAVWQQLGALSLATGLVVLGLAFAFGEITSRALSDLVSGARRLADGDYRTPIAPTGTGEILTLSSALHRTRQRLAEVVEDEERHQSERQRQTEQLRDLLRRDLKLQEEERRHIAAEMHDAVSPLITGALYQSRALQRANGGATSEMVNETLTDVNELLERASQELHGIIFDLRPPDLDDIGVVAALEAYVSSIKRTGLQARLVVVDEPPPLTSEVRLGIYRIVQEALHNILRHSGADEAVVRMEYQDSLLRVTIHDNGIGFDPNQARRPTSLGLLSMRERAAAIGADFEILSRPGGGTAIVIERRDTGSVMSDELLDDLLAHRTQDDPQLTESPVPSDNDTDGHNLADETQADANAR